MPGVDVLLGERRDRAVLVELVLHEDEVPELEEALALAAGRALGPAAADLLAPVVEELGVRPAGARAADRPEVVRPVEADDALGRHALRLPEADRFLVLAEAELGIACEDGHPELLGVDLHVVEDELPGEVDRAFLEVLARTRSCRASRRTSGGSRRARPRRCRACGRPSGRSSSSGAGGVSRPRK